MPLPKLDRFRWQVADHEAFRLEVETESLLRLRTAFRGEGEPVPDVFGGGIRAGGICSRADVARVLALHIEVLPEIEVPAQSHAMVKAVPGLRDLGDWGAAPGGFPADGKDGGPGSGAEGRRGHHPARSGRGPCAPVRPDRLAAAPRA